MIEKKGTFVISLDCELMWGVRDEVTKETYGQHILGDHQVIPRLLNLFDAYAVKGTFAFVGFLFCKNKAEILSHIPQRLPAYKNKNLSPYGNYIETAVGNSFEDDPYNYGWNQVEQVRQYPQQEISTHTFSHYYCMEEGQTVQDFEADIEMAIKIATEKGIHITSIIFPRNQVNDLYLEVCSKAGIFSYRGTEQSWIYSARSYKNESLTRRLVRLMDSYINISGHHCYTYKDLVHNNMVNIPSSRFLRPYTRILKWFEYFRLRRIKTAMTHAAKNNLVYHLWWHPHNFGINQDENFAFLEEILRHYQYLHNKYSFSSDSMSTLSKELYANKG